MVRLWPGDPDGGFLCVFLIFYNIKKGNRTNGLTKVFILPVYIRHLCPVGKGPGLNGLSYPLSVVILSEAEREVYRRLEGKSIPPEAAVAFRGLSVIVTVKTGRSTGIMNERKHSRFPKLK